MASQAMIVKFCEASSTRSVVGPFGLSGLTTNARRDHRDERAPRRRPRWRRRCPSGPGAPPVGGSADGGGRAAAEGVAGAAERRRRRWRRERTTHTAARYRAGVRNRWQGCRRCASEYLPLRPRLRRGRSMGRFPTRSRPRMSRRQTDLEPGVEPDTGEPESFGAPNGRPPTPPPGWRPGRPVVRQAGARTTAARRTATGRAAAEPVARSAARRRCAGCRGSCSR